MPSSRRGSRPRGPACGSTAGRAGSAGTPPGAAHIAGSGSGREPGTSGAAWSSRSVISWPSGLLCRAVEGALDLQPLEGEAQRVQERAPMLVAVRIGHDRDVHAPGAVHLVVVDLGEDQLLGHPDGVVAAPVERVGVQAPKVSD